MSSNITTFSDIVTLVPASEADRKVLAEKIARGEDVKFKVKAFGDAEDPVQTGDATTDPAPIDDPALPTDPAPIDTPVLPTDPAPVDAPALPANPVPAPPLKPHRHHNRHNSHYHNIPNHRNF